MDGGVEVGNGYGPLDDMLGQFIGNAYRTTMLQSSAGQHQRESTRLMSTASGRIKLRWPSEFRTDYNQRFV